MSKIKSGVLSDLKILNLTAPKARVSLIAFKSLLTSLFSSINF